MKQTADNYGGHNAGKHFRMKLSPVKSEVVSSKF
jgi:hypothetical protein